jgi:ubiquinone/menaquinone biosynthesis C-methylase UbiE
MVSKNVEYDLDKSIKWSKETLLDKLTFRPVIEKAIGDVKNKTVLDVGCGSGRYSALMAKRGANVIGIDISKYQINLAKQINSNPKIRYIVGDGSNVPFIPDNSIDFILMNMVVPSILSKRKLSQTMREMHRILKQNGRLIISTLHPFFVIPDSTIDSTISFNKRHYFNEGHKYKSRAYLSKGGYIKFTETHFSLSYISKAMMDNGLFIKQILESKQSPRFSVYLPKFIIFLAEKYK